MMRRRLLLVPDGMADEPQAALGMRTPLEAARTPYMDGLARNGIVGRVRTVPEGLPPGSDVANLAVLGYDPAACFSGRSPLEAASIGVELGPADVAYRLNFVTVVDGLMKDNTAGHISDEDGRRLIDALSAALGGGAFEFHQGVSYRNLLVWRGGAVVPLHAAARHPGPARRRAPARRGGGRGGERGRAVPSPPCRPAATRSSPGCVRRRTPGSGARARRRGCPRSASLYGLSGAVVGAVDLVRGIGPARRAWT